MSFLRKNWLRTIGLIGLFIASGTAPFLIEQQILPMVQLSSMVTDFYDPLSGDFNIDELLNNLVGINVLASSQTQTTLLITTMIWNKPYNFYPMKIPAVNLDLYFKAGRPYDREKQIIQQFKADPNFGDVKEPWFDPLTYSWVRTANILIPQEINIPVGAPAPVSIIVTLYTNGQDENALSQMIGTIIRQNKIPGKRLYAKGEVQFMGMPIPISLEVPEFAMPTSGEDTSALSDTLQSIFVDLQPETPSFDMFQSLDLRNYDDQNGNYYRDWNDSIPNGIKDAGENFTEPLYQNGTLSVSIFLRLQKKLSIGGGVVELTPSPWNLQEGQNQTSTLAKYGDPSYWETGKVPDPFVTRYTPKPEIANSLWGTSDQQILLYVPAEWAAERGMDNWKNRIFGCVGFTTNRTLNLDGHGKSVPILLSADLKVCGDARPNSNFSTGEAFKFIAPLAVPSLLTTFNFTDLDLGVIGNIKLKLGNMPLSLVINMVIKDIGSMLGTSDQSLSENSALKSLEDAATSSASDIAGELTGFFSLNNFIFNGLAMDVYNKVMQTNTSLDLDFYMPYGFYFPETEEEAKNILNIGGGPIQIFNESKPDNWNTLNESFPYNIPDTVFTETFENYNDNTAWHSSAYWDIFDSSPDANVTLVTNGGKDGTKGIIQTTNYIQNTTAIRRNFAPQDGISGVYFDVNFTNTDGDFYVKLQNSTTEMLSIRFQNGTDGVYITLGGSTAYLQRAKWYRVYVAADRDAGTFDVTVSGNVNETLTPNGVITSFQLKNTVSSSDFNNLIAFNEEDINDTRNANGITNAFDTSRTIRQMYYVMNNESFSCDGTTFEYTLTNDANTTGALVQVKGVNATNEIIYTYTSGVPAAGYQYTFDSGSRKVRTYYNGNPQNLTSDYTVYISHFVEEDRYSAPVGGSTVTYLGNTPSASTTITIAYHARDKNSFTLTTSASSGYEFTWNPASRQITTYNDGNLYAIPSYYQTYIDYNIGTIASGIALTNNLVPTNLTISMNASKGPIAMDNIGFRNSKTLKEAQAKWYQDKLVMNLTLESGSLQTVFTKLFTKIGSYRNGMGIAYHFNSKHLIGAYGTNAVGYYSKLLDNIMDTSTGHPLGTWPTGNETYDVNIRGLPRPKVNFQITLDDIKLNVAEVFPETGPGLDSIIYDMGIDPLLIKYLNQSLVDWGLRTGKGSGPGGIGTLTDLLLFDPTTLLSFLYQDGPNNDLFDYMVAQNYLNETYSALNITALVSGLLDLLGFEDLTSAASSSGDSTDMYAMIPELLQATNIDFEDMVLDLIDYLRYNMSYSQGIKPFELLDLIFSSSGTSTTDLVSGINEESWYVIFEDLKSLLNIINIMDLADVAIDNPLPFMDYLNRSQMMSEQVLLPLLSSLFAESPTGEPFDWDKILRNVDDLMRGLLFGVEIPDGVTQPWENKGMNLMAFLQSAESVLDYNPLTNETFTQDDALQLLANLYNQGNGLDIFTSGEGQYIADVPPYDNLKLMSKLVLWLMQSGFDAEALYKLLADLGILDLTELSGGGSGDPNDMTAGINALIPILGTFCPPGEWLSLLRSLGIWSTWEGYFEMVTTVILDVILIGEIRFDIDVANLLGGSLVNLEKLLATGIMEILPNFGMASIDLPFNFQLSLNENQSYGNPWYYQMGYDSSANLGPWLQGQTGSSADCDNWGWVPLGWDPGGNPTTNPQNPWGDPDKNYTSDKGSAYKKDFISRLVSYLPLAIDLDLPTIDIQDMYMHIIDLGIADVSMILNMMLPIDLSVRLRMEGNPAGLVELMENQGISLMGYINHLYPDANQWIYDAFGSLAGGGGGTGEEEIIDFDQLDLTQFFDTYLSSGIDLYQVFQYMLDPDFLPTSKWYLDPAYMMWDINASGPDLIDNPLPYTLYWDYDWNNDPLGVLPYGGYNVTQTKYFGDGDFIPDEYPWYRFTIPALNQENPNRGPGTYQQADINRYPPIVDDITPIGYPGQGYYMQAPDGIPDGLQHYWFDTPYAFVNATINRASDPWVNIDPLQWDNTPGAGYYTWTYGGDTYYWGDQAPAHPRRPGFPYEQVPLISGASDWDTKWAPLYQSGTVAPDPSIAQVNVDGYPDIWDCFQYTLDQVDARFGYWDYNRTDKSIDGTGYDYLDCLPFWTLMSLGVTPHIPGAIDTFNIPSMMTDVTAAVSANMGSDYWHRIEYNQTYRWFEPNWVYWDNYGFEYDSNTTLNSNNSDQYWRGMSIMENATTVFDEYGNLIWTDYGNGTLRIWDPVNYYGTLYDVDLSPFGMLQWIWEGAGDVVKVKKEGSTWKSYLTKYLAPYSTPDLEGTLNWLSGKGLGMNNILDMLPQIIEEFSGTGQTSSMESLLTTDTIVSAMQTMEDYFRRVPGTLNRTDWAINHDHNSENAYLNITQNRTRAAEIILGMLSSLPEVIDINPSKATRGLLSYLMPRLGDIFGTSTIGGEGGTTDMLQGLSDLLHNSGLIDIIFQDTSKLRNLAFDLSIQNTYLNITLNGWDIINFDLDGISIPVNVTSLGETLQGSDISSTDTGSSLPISLPIDFVKPLPYIELSTFNGPYSVEFESVFANGTIVPNVEVSHGEVQYWEDPKNPDNHSYYFNVTVYNSSRIGWYDDLGQPSAPPTAHLYITNGTYAMTHTDGSGKLNISGNIVTDSFGWVDPYVYIHCEPIDSNVFYYWWNVTTNSTQLTLGGNREIGEARWVYDKNGEVPDLIIQQSTPFNGNVTNIDNDPWYEIFARVEIDDTHMDAVQKIVFMANGTIDTINVSHGLDYNIRLWDSYELQDKVWPIEGSGGNTKYTFDQAVTPDGSNVIYPTGPKVITGIRVNSGNWIDDTLTKAQIYYYDVEDSSYTNPIYLLNWDIRKNASWIEENYTGANRASLLYQYQTDTWTHDETPGNWEWSLTGSIDRSGGLEDWANDLVTFQLNETTYGGQDYTNLYRILDYDMFFSNFSQKTLTNYQVWYNYYEVPEGDGYGSKKAILAYQYDGRTTYPGTTFTIDRERRGGSPLIYGYNVAMQNSTDPAIGYDLIWNAGNTYFNGTSSPPRTRNTSTGAYWAQFIYEIPISSDEFISQIDWTIINLDNPNENNAIGVNCSVYYAGDANGANAGWKVIQNATYGDTYSAASNGGIWQRSITSMKNVSGQFYDPISSPNEKKHWLYLTSRGNDASENFTKIRFEIWLKDNVTDGGFSNLGWNDTSPADIDDYNTPENVSIKIELTKYPFLTDWGVNTFELPQGVISGFHINAKMWDPQGLQAGVFPASARNFYPNVTFGYMTVDMENGTGLTPPLNTNLTALGSKVQVHFEMEDSIINRDVAGGRGDALYVDGNRTYGIIWNRLLDANMPNVITNTSVITIETNYRIDVNIGKDNAFRNYYLNLTLNNSRGYIELTRLVTLCDNTEVSGKMGIFPPKAVIDIQNGYPHIYQLGTKIDINPAPAPYTIEYQLTFRASATFLKDFWVNGSSVVEFLWFSAIWDKPRGTFEVSSDRYIKPTTEGNMFRIVRIQ
ncbi:MAG: hypothetical protein ACTSRG_07305 [Candidatus Helarchaeota archaeon]